MSKELLELIKKGRDTMKSSKKSSEEFKSGYDLCATSVIEVIEEQSTLSDLSKIKVDDNGKVLDEPKFPTGERKAHDGLAELYDYEYKQYQQAKYLPEWIEEKNKRIKDSNQQSSTLSGMVDSQKKKLQQANDKIKKQKANLETGLHLLETQQNQIFKLEQANEQIQKLKEGSRELIYCMDERDSHLLPNVLKLQQLLKD